MWRAFFPFPPKHSKEENKNMQIRFFLFLLPFFSFFLPSAKLTISAVSSPVVEFLFLDFPSLLTVLDTLLRIGLFLDMTSDLDLEW